jgi:pimeloyl-ACP methyl ester carboxylesterase
MLLARIGYIMEVGAPICSTYSLGRGEKEAITTALINGYDMHYIDQGRGTAILFIHPPVLTSLNFSYQIQGLLPHFRTVAFDIRGHGQSGASEQPLTFPLIVEDIRQLLDRLGIEKCFLCGYSTGSSILLEFLLTYPERALGGIVIGGMSEARKGWLRNFLSLGVVLSKIGAVSTIALSTAWSQVQDYASFRTLFNDAKKTRAKQAEQYYQYSLTYNCTSRLPEIRLPILLVYGGRDKPFHPYADLLHRQLPDSELVFIPHADHRIPTKAPETLNARMKQFIDRILA